MESKWPADWEVRRLGEVMLIERGGSPRPIKKFITEATDGINWIKISDATASGKYIIRTQEKIIPEGVSRSRMVYEGDFILSNSMSFGRPYIMKTNGCIHDGWLVLRSKPEYEIDKDFLYYLLSSPLVYEQFNALAAGSTVRNLNIGLVNSVKIPLPPIHIQKQIARKLDGFFAEYEILQKEKEVGRENHERILDGVIAKFLEGCSVVHRPLSEVCEINPSKREASHLTDRQEVSFVPMAAVDDVTGRILESQVKTFGAVKTGYTYFAEGDILFAKITPCMENGKAAIARNLTNRVGFGSTEFHVLRCKPGLVPEFLYYYIRQKTFRSNARMHMTGTAGQLRVPSSFLEEFKIPLPSEEDQKRIVQMLESVRDIEAVMRDEVQVLDSNVDKLPHAVLTKAFRGELVS